MTRSLAVCSIDRLGSRAGENTKHLEHWLMVSISLLTGSFKALYFALKEGYLANELWSCLSMQRSHVVLYIHRSLISDTSSYAGTLQRRTFGTEPHS